MADYKRTRTVVKGDRSSVCRIERSSLLIIITALGWSASAESHFLRVKFDNEAPLFSLFKFFHCLYVTNIDCNSREMWNRRCFFFFSCPLPTNQPTNHCPTPANQFNIILNGEKTNKYLLSFRWPASSSSSQSVHRVKWKSERPHDKTYTARLTSADRSIDKWRQWVNNNNNSPGDDLDEE